MSVHLNYRQRIEMAERLKKEEEERNARRKRVEAIMLRTRGKNQSNSSAKVILETLNILVFRLNLKNIQINYTGAIQSRLKLT